MVTAGTIILFVILGVIGIAILFFVFFYFIFPFFLVVKDETETVNKKTAKGKLITVVKALGILLALLTIPVIAIMCNMH